MVSALDAGNSHSQGNSLAGTQSALKNPTYTVKKLKRRRKATPVSRVFWPRASALGVFQRRKIGASEITEQKWAQRLLDHNTASSLPQMNIVGSPP
jgi:hypothetical protein